MLALNQSERVLAKASQVAKAVQFNRFKLMIRRDGTRKWQISGEGQGLEDSQNRQYNHSMTN